MKLDPVAARHVLWLIEEAGGVVGQAQGWESKVLKEILTLQFSYILVNFPFCHDKKGAKGLIHCSSNECKHVLKHECKYA